MMMDDFDDDDVLCRKAVRHLIVRRCNERTAELRDDRMPVLLTMHPRSLEELLIDSDPAEAWTLDFEGMEFMGIPVSTTPGADVGVIVVDWPPALEPAEPTDG